MVVFVRRQTDDHRLLNPGDKGPAGERRGEVGEVGLVADEHSPFAFGESLVNQGTCFPARRELSTDLDVDGLLLGLSRGRGHNLRRLQGAHEGARQR